MITRPNDLKNTMISGIFMIVGLIVTMIFIFMLSSESSLLSTRIDLVTSVDNIQNLKKGAAVQLRGMRIGTVKDINIQSLDSILITVSIDASHQEWIRRDSYFTLRTQGVLGDRYLEILGGTQESPSVQDGDHLLVKDDSTIDMFINKGEDLLVVASRVLQRLDHILGNVQEDSLGSILGQLDEMTDSLSQLTLILQDAKMDEMFSDMSLASRELKNTSESISRITNQIEQGPGTINSLIYDNSLHTDIQRVLGGAQRNRLLQYFMRESIKKAD